MKIAMFGQKTVPSRMGGIEVVVENLATRMVAKGNCVALYNRKTKTTSNKVKEYKGVEIYTVPTIDKKGLAAVSGSFFASVLVSLKKYDIVHIHAEGPAFFSWIPKLFNKKVVVTVHGLDWQREKWKNGIGSKFIQIGEKNAVKYADAIIVLNESNQKYFKEKYNRDTILIPNGVNIPNKLSANLIKKEWGLTKNSYILFLGRIVPEKGIENLILAYKRIKTNKKLVIAGGSSDTDEFYKRLKLLAKNDSRIIFTGAVKEKKLEELFSNAYLYTLPSNLEGMPLSLMEAMSYGNAVLVSDIPECTNVVGNNAIVFQHNNIDDLEKKLKLALKNQDLVFRLKDVTSKYILSKYNWNDIVNKTLLVYKECIND